MGDAQAISGLQAAVSICSAYSPCGGAAARTARRKPLAARRARDLDGERRAGADVVVVEVEDVAVDAKDAWDTAREDIVLCVVRSRRGCVCVKSACRGWVVGGLVGGGSRCGGGWNATGVPRKNPE